MIDQTYYWIAVAIAFVALLRVPSKMGGLDNVGGAFVAALAFGWLLWPAFIYAALKARQQQSVKDSGPK